MAVPARSLWTRLSRRTGLLALKVGMVPAWTGFGQRIPLTVLSIEGCTVVQTKTVGKEGYNALQVGAGDIKEHVPR